jgi:hypothetical protein
VFSFEIPPFVKGNVTFVCPAKDMLLKCFTISIAVRVFELDGYLLPHEGVTHRALDELITTAGEDN